MIGQSKTILISGYQLTPGEQMLATMIEELRNEVRDLLDSRGKVKYYSTTKAAALLGFSESHIRGLCSTGKIKTANGGKHYRIPATEIARLKADIKSLTIGHNFRNRK